VELQMELVRVRRILHRLDPVARAQASRTLRAADENMAMNSLEGMRESISDLQEIKTEKQKANG
jgi:hypothetical protein